MMIEYADRESKEESTVESFIVRPHQSDALNFQFRTLLKHFDRAYVKNIGPLDSPDHKAERKLFATFVARELVSSQLNNPGKIQHLSSEFNYPTKKGTNLTIRARSMFVPSIPAGTPEPGQE
jgi:hypothetical protein